MRKHQKTNYNDPWERDYYGTGSTKPPKNHGSIIACLLVLVILLGGVCSALGLLNVRLLRELANADPEPVTVYMFQRDSLPPKDAQPTESDGRIPKLGLWGQTVSDFDRRFYGLPYGVLVTDVMTQDSEEQVSLRPGDVIVSLNGRVIRDREGLLQVLATLGTDRVIRVNFYRQQTRTTYSIYVTVMEGT